MSKTRWQRYRATGAIILMGMTLLFLSTVGFCADSDSLPGVVRMGVDPTILPPVPPPGGPMSQQESPLDPVESLDPGVSEEPASPADQKQLEAVLPDPAVPPASASIERGQVHAIAISSTANGFELKVDCDRPVGKTTVLNLDAPRRLVVDILGAWQFTGGNVIRTGQGMVKYVVLGEHADKLRLVFHFTAHTVPTLLPKITRDGNSVTIAASVR